MAERVTAAVLSWETIYHGITTSYAGEVGPAVVKAPQSRISKESLDPDTLAIPPDSPSD